MTNTSELPLMFGLRPRHCRHFSDSLLRRGRRTHAGAFGEVALAGICADE
ncbi:hypothetical protein MJ904_18315 [Massilia sp. MB5]|nr:hypothetical protein [Massilia sp. MB5]UMR29038.1 hypothetical protein MJ904_18315 [Massilia sp. MB5]